MKLTCYKSQKAIELKNGGLVKRSEFDEIINGVMDGLVVIAGDDETEISVKNYVAGSLLYHSEKDLGEFLCGMTKKLGDIERKMREELTNELEMVFNDHQIAIDEGA